MLLQTPNPTHPPFLLQGLLLGGNAIKGPLPAGYSDNDNLQEL